MLFVLVASLVGGISEANGSHPLSFALAKDNPKTKKLKKLPSVGFRIIRKLAIASFQKIEKKSIWVLLNIFDVLRMFVKKQLEKILALY